MKEQQRPSHTYYDSLSSTRYSLQDGSLIATTDGGESSVWTIPTFREDIGKSLPRSYLKFTSKSNNHILLNPTSTLIVCKSEKVQEVETNKTYLSGQTWWQIFVPHTTLFLTVGVKDKKSNKSVAFDYSLKYSAKLSFKLNLENLTFKTWINGSQSQSKPAVTLEAGCSWTPFVRVRQIGSSISLNPFVTDPEGIISNLNFSVLGLPDADIGTEPKSKQLEEEKINIEANQNLKNLQFIYPNTLMLTGQKQVKFIRRNYYNHQFTLDSTLQTEINNEVTYYLIALSQGEHLLLQSANQKWQTSLFDDTVESIDKSRYWLRKTKDEWLSWAHTACRFLDNKLLKEQSQQLVLSVYEVLVAKFQELRNVLQSSDLRLTNWSRFDLKLVQKVDNLSFNSSNKSNFMIQPSVTFNNYPALVFQHGIVQSSTSQNYAFFQFEANKITVVSIRGLPFKVGDFILSKAIKKQNELTEYQKQAEQINNNDLTKPSIYKILKNCLKYADKVKPPAKLVKQLENKRNQLKEKEKEKKPEVKKDEIVPDVSLENTLVQMGFQIKIARRALIECKNSSLEAAMDLIINQTIKVQETPKVIPKSDWTCQACTLFNLKTALICVACDSPAPVLDFIQEVNEPKHEHPQRPAIEEEIHSEKIEEPLRSIYPFQTNIALSPLIIGGVFQSKIRFRLFCLNPKFYSTFYQKNDGYVDLTSNSINQLGHQLKTSSIQDLAFNYFSQTELKQKKFGWIPVEDYDLEITEEVAGIQYSRVEENKQNLVIRIDIGYSTHKQSVFLNLDTSKVYLEKARSLSICKEALQTHHTMSEPATAFLPYQIFALTNRIQPNQKQVQFRAYFADDSNSAQISEIVDVASYGGEIESKKKLPLYVVESSQITGNYPYVSFYTYSKLPFNDKQLFKNGIVLGHLQNNKLAFESFTIQISHKEHNLSGFIYLANDYTLQPLKKYRFDLKENTKLINFKIEKTEAFYVVLVLDAQQTKTVELTQFTAYGEVLEGFEKVNPRSLKVQVPSQSLNINLVGQNDETQSPITSYEVQSYIINPTYDLSLLDEASRNRLVGNGFGDIQITIVPAMSESSLYKSLTLSSICIDKLTLVKIDTKIRQLSSQQSQETLRANFNLILEEYLVSHQKVILEKVVSTKYSAFKEDLGDKNLQSFILDYVTVMPYNQNQKRYAQFFFKYFESTIIKYKNKLNLAALIQAGLTSQNITANGLQLLISLNRLTQALSCDILASIAFRSMDKIAEWRQYHEQPYSPYAQAEIFSSHIHNLLTNRNEESRVTCRKRQFDEIHHRTILKKYKFSKKYLIDLLSVYSIRQIQLAFQRSNSKNKLVVSIKWFDDEGLQVDAITNFYDYPVWKQLVASDSSGNKAKNSITGYLSLSLQEKDMKARYVIIEINNTLRPFNASRPQIQNIADNEIIPIVYGTYIGEQQPLLNLGFDYDREKLKFVKKIGHLTKFSFANTSAETSLFEEEDLQAIESLDLELIKKKLQIGDNKEKFVGILMKTASNKTIDFHYTTLTVLLEELTKNKVIDSLNISQKTLEILIQNLLKKQVGAIKQICLNFLKGLNTTHADLYKTLLKYSLSQNQISYLFNKQNPLSLPEGRDFILAQLKNNKETNFIENVHELLRNWQGDEADQLLTEIGSELLSRFQSAKQFDNIATVCSKLGWIQGVDKIISSISKTKGMSYLAKHISVTARKDSPLTDYLLSSLKVSPPTQITWIILNELGVRSSKNPNIDSIDSIFKQLLEWVGKFSEDDESQISVAPLVENIMKFQSKFKLGAQVFKSLVRIYFSLDSRSSLLSQFLKLSLLSAPYASEVLLKQSLAELSNYIIQQKKAKQLRQSEDGLRFILDILSFIFKQSEGSNNSSVHFSADLEREALNILSALLINSLNLGGNKGCRHIKFDLTNKLLISFYLSKMVSQVELATDKFEGLLRWYIINTNQNSDLSEEQQKLATEFNLIRDNVWNSIVKQLSEFNEDTSTAASRTINQIFESANQIDNSFLIIAYESKVWSLLKKLLQQQQKSGALGRSVNKILKEDGIFRRLLRQVAQMKSFYSEENKVVVERELANELRLVDQTKPKDWLQFKSGAKNHVQEIQFIDTSKNFKTLVFESESPFWLSQLTIAFECDYAANKITPSPSEIILEVGSSLEDMSYVGRLEHINSQLYDAYSTKVHSINLHRARGRNFQQGRTKLCNFVRLTIKSPYLNNFRDLGSGKKVSYINFLSMQGYMQNGKTLPPSDVSSLVDCIQVLSTPGYKSILTEMLSEAETVAAFKSSLINISYLMNIEANTAVLHNFLLRVCELNSEVGDEMLSGYLQLKNPHFCSKIAAEIVLSNLLKGNSRIESYFAFITANLQSRKDVDRDLLPFIDKFTQIVTIAEQSNKINGGKASPLTFTVSKELVDIVIAKSQTNRVYLKFAKFILSASHPFAVTGFDLLEALSQLFLNSSAIKNELLACLITTNSRCRDWFIERRYLEELLKDILLKIQQAADIASVTNKLRFLTLICESSQLKGIITKLQYDLQIFQILINKKSENLLSNVNNKEFRERLVEFIAKASLGSQNERIIGALLKDSLNTLDLQNSQQFIAQIFLPLLNSYSRSTVNLIPFSQSQNKILMNLSSLKVAQTTQKVDVKQEESYKLFSNILSSEEKALLFQKIRSESLYKWGNFTILTNHGKSSTPRNLQAVTSKVARNSEHLLLLFQTKESRFGLFYNSSKGSQAFNSRSLKLTKGSFFFKLEGKQIKIFGKVGSAHDQILSIQSANKKNEGSEAEEVLYLRYRNQLIAEVYFNGINASYFYPNALTHQTDKKTQSIEIAEYWTFDPSSIQSYESVFISDSKFAAKLLAQFEDIDLLPKNVKADANVELLRYGNLYEFPSSITIKQLKSLLQIMSCRISEQKLKNLTLIQLGGQKLNETTTLQSIIKGSEREDLVIDILVDLDNTTEQLQSSKTKVEFLPKKGILKYFQENDGVKTMIRVIKKSIGEWKNVVRKQKWIQYVTELQKFSSFPHFFSVYLKDKDTFTLLLNLLSGLPDKETDTKWDELQASYSQKLLKIIEDILKMDRSNQFRNYALKNDFVATILERLRLMTGIFKRRYQEVTAVEEESSSPTKNQTDDDGVKKIKKKKGVGYSADTNSNTKWMKEDNISNIKKNFENVEIILNMVESFLNVKNWPVPNLLVEQILESALLPYTEDCLRAGTLLQISKHPEKFKAILNLIRSICNHDKLVVCILPLSPNYQPSQNESIESLLKSLCNISKIFISCLNQNASKEDKLSQELANDIIETYNIVQEFVEENRQAEGQEGNQKELLQILELSLDKKYRELLKDLRFDYMDMKESPAKIKHHYASNFTANYTPNQNKMIRLAQELADISTALPYEHTNAVYVRCDKDRIDFMQALIMGSNGTPYGHGAFLFDIYFQDTYPSGPPKVNLTTTGHGKIRFNPNLYACGKVCLSLLGTWRGSASQNWEPKVSTLLQVLLSIQAIIMSEEVYFNEPGFENEQGTEEGEKKNEAYSNIVRYGNVKFAMLENIRNPPKGFESIIRRHFYLKRDQIMEECKKWIKYAEKRPANYVGLVNDHNVSWAAEFKKTKTQYKEMLEKAVKELEEELYKLPAPKTTDMAQKNKVRKPKKKKQVTGNAMETLQNVKHEQIDVSYEIKNQLTEGKELDINDEKVKDRWSRYIGAMGIDAVNKQSKADILVFGLGPFALEAVKNLVLSGCRKLTLCEDSPVTTEDLSGGFFYQEEDRGKNRVESILYKIRELNSYVRVDAVKQQKLTSEIIQTYSLVLATQLSFKEQIRISKICREKNIKFMSADCRSAYCRLVNDFGEFTVLDKNGEEPIQVMIKDIQISEKGLVTLLDGVKHPYQDGEVVVINNVEGMENKQDKAKSINSTLHTIKVVTFKSFEIGNTLHYQNYIRNGTAKNIKTPVIVKFRPFEAAIDPTNTNLEVQSNLETYDFSKLTHAKIVHTCFLTLDLFVQTHKRLPEPWNIKQSEFFFALFESYWKDNLQPAIKTFVKEFVFTCRGNLPPLCAFFGGLVAQQVIKGITQKYKPIHSTFFIDFSEVIPKREIEGEWSQEELNKIYSPKNTRDEGFAIVVGTELLNKIKQAKLFMIGAGAIGCQLLKNFAMVGLGTGSQGKIVLTDPDHIQNSNLNRQFLFREKHISKPKSLTAAASILSMNPYLKGHISPLLERVSDATKDIFNNKFFQSLTVVANALDNVAARRYVDQRCVQNKVPLFESGTLGPKGHVQVIIPYLTESYGSQNDPVEEGQIPHCTLKLFPQETLHCIQWARDNFGKKFTLQPKALAKYLEKGFKPEADDIKSLNQSLTMITKGPHNFEDCIYYAITKFYKYFRDDILQLMYTYPLDAKTKNGEPFWRLPKRPPTAIMEFNPTNILHCTFVASLAVLLAKIYQIPFPKEFRTEGERLNIGKQASKIKIPEFVPSDQKAKAILKETVADEKKEKQKKQGKTDGQDEDEQQIDINSKDQIQLHSQIISTAGQQFSIKAEQFEKDDDSNGHIDYIYAMANLRANNYKLEPMDWMTTKIKAGRIIPALSTTTSCVAGLQTLQICKYIQRIKIADMRNSYLNLAVPSLQMSEPGQVKKSKITEKLVVSIWDRWELQCKEDITFGEIYERLQAKYGLFPKGVLQGMSRIDMGKSEHDKKSFLKSIVLQKLEKEDEYIDIAVLFTLNEEDEKIIENIPTVRLSFSAK